MSSPSVKLYRLRGIFVAYFVLKSVIGAAVAWSMLRSEVLGNLNYGPDFREFPPGSLQFFSLIIAAMILAVAWLVFGQLLRRRNWARVLLLVVGWLTVISAVFSLLMSTSASQFSSWIAQWLPNMDWEKLMQYDRVQKVFELLFWGYLISVLQFDPAVRDEFFPQEPVEKTPGK
jgi:hypothetical protein